MIRDKTGAAGSWSEPGLRHSEPVRTPAWESVSPAAESAPAVSRRDSRDVYHEIKADMLTHSSGKLNDHTGLSPLRRLGAVLGEGMRVPTADQIIAADDYISPWEAASLSAAKPALSAGEALARSVDRDFGGEASHKRMDELGDRLDATLKKAEEAHPLAYAFGGAVGTIPLVNGVAAAVGAIPGVEALGANLRAALTGGAAVGANRLLDGIGAVSAGRADPREYLLDASRGALGGALAAGTLEELSELGQKLLLPRSAGSGAAGLLPGTAGGRGKLRDILGLLGTGQNDLTKNAADAAAAALRYMDGAAAALPGNVHSAAQTLTKGYNHDTATSMNTSHDLYKNDGNGDHDILDPSAETHNRQDNDRNYFTAASNEGKALINEVRSRGYKITEEDVIGIVRDPMNKVVWLERGHLDGRPSGRAHIVDKHETDFFSKGITATDLDDFILNAVAQGKIVGVQGRGRTIYETVYHGKTYRVAVTIGDNGYIVGANPT